MKNAHLLIVDDHVEVVEWLVEELVRESYRVTGCASAREALDLLAREPFDLLVTDIEMPGMRGLELMEAAHRTAPSLPVILITAFGSVELAVRAVRAGATDFVTKPFTIEVLLLSIEKALSERQMRREIVRLRRSVVRDTVDGIVARSPAMRRVLDRAARAAGIDSSVLLTGETGTGKGTVAGYIHSRSPRAKGPFVQVNCSTLPANLAESELFGARKGAFTDAREDRDGLFARAHRGTLFLDEVGELPSEVQPKLLRALETGRIRPLGSAQEITVDARIIAATNHPLDQAVLARQFRADLLFRLDVIRIDIPPLRERPEDLEPLTDFFVERIGARLGRPILGISEDGLRWLLSRPWVGNARELSNCIERAIAFAEGDTLTLADFSGDAPLGDRALPSDGSLTAAAASGKSLDEVQIGYIQAVIAASGGNMAEAARRLGIDRRTLYRRLATARSGS